MTVVSLANRKKEEVLESRRPHTFAYITGSIVSDAAVFFTFLKFQVRSLVHYDGIFRPYQKPSKSDRLLP